MDFLGDLADGADGSLNINMTIEAFLLIIGMIGYTIIQVWKYWRNGKRDRRRDGNGHSPREERLLRENGKILLKIEGHMATQAITHNQIFEEQRNTTLAIIELKGATEKTDVRIEAFLQAHN